MAKKAKVKRTSINAKLGENVANVEKRAAPMPVRNHYSKRELSPKEMAIYICFCAGSEPDESIAAEVIAKFKSLGEVSHSRSDKRDMSYGWYIILLSNSLIRSEQHRAELVEIWNYFGLSSLLVIQRGEIDAKIAQDLISKLEESSGLAGSQLGSLKQMLFEPDQFAKELSVQLISADELDQLDEDKLKSLANFGRS